VIVRDVKGIFRVIPIRDQILICSLPRKTLHVPAQFPKNFRYRFDPDDIQTMSAVENSLLTEIGADVYYAGYLSQKRVRVSVNPWTYDFSGAADNSIDHF